MENTMKGSILVLEIILKISSIMLNITNITSKIVEIYKQKHQKSNRDSQS